MKIKLACFNLALVLYLAGLLCAIGVSMGFGAIIVLVASVIVLCLYLVLVYQAFREKKLFSLTVLVYTLGVMTIGEVFLQGFSIAIDQSLFGLSWFYQLHAFIGLTLLGLFIGHSITLVGRVESETNRGWLFAAVGIFFLISLIGFLSFARILPGSARLTYYGFVFLTFFYLLYFLVTGFLVRKPNALENRVGFLLSALLVLFWILRWRIPDLIAPGFNRVTLHIGFVMIVILPLAILLIKKNHFLTAFILYTIVLDLYFISYDREVKYLVNVGGN